MCIKLVCLTMALAEYFYIKYAGEKGQKKIYKHLSQIK